MTNITETKAKILIVEDTETNIDILMETLSEEYELSVAINGEKALRLLENYKPDLVLLDVMMPGIDGYEVCRRLKADQTVQGIPVIFLTALSDEGNEAKGLELGAIDYITKPFNPAIVKARVRNNLSLKLYRDHLEELVQERTRQLTLANARLATMDRVKSDFMRVISHEMRTPANGVLGLGELLFELCPDSEEKRQLWSFFEQSQSRMVRLLDNALLLNTLDSEQTNSPAEVVPLAAIINKISSAGIPSELTTPENELPQTGIIGLRQSLEEAFGMLLELAQCFCSGDKPIRLTVLKEKDNIIFRFELTNIDIQAEAASDFFDIESTSRSGSAAEPLGLSPVVAQKIISVWGGSVRLLPGKDKIGTLEAMLPIDQG
ncbi:MAG: response regulator [Victivallaceae bacterium]